VLESLPARLAIIDCELVACDESGMPCFQTLMTLRNKAPALCLWCFDLLVFDGDAHNEKYSHVFALPSRSGSLAKFRAIRQASTFVSRSVRPRRTGSSSK
jgi:hypothetical protein